MKRDYHSESGKIKADLHLAVANDFNTWYTADFTFYTDPVYLTDKKEGFSDKTHYASNDFSDLFARLKRAESGIE